ncbi:unnamed protein product [Prorocentrum cordatum]|uniref:Glutathione transferase n=1 Tax=Prorocentrum cordatum TaxID=2364126 RepID=A0ABN9XV30_9DINO|nr:unnamed protein product [Polarella glacialis]|mmetsp:Transcript_68993/g.179769  ORF Transcript_68993/g.179769 Transcript_68993/m.179769 type:complete len:229 (-) Transcript_68993:227-913(-)
MTQPLMSDGANGLPVADEAEKSKASAKSVKMISAIFVVGHAISFGLAFAIYKLGSTSKYDSAAKAAFNADGSGMGAYAFFSAVVYSMLTWWLNMYPLIPKSRVMLQNKQMRSNMYIYQVNGSSPSEQPAVLLDETGDVGMYNRANRSMHHFTEWTGGVLFTSLCCIHVYPFPVFVLIVVLAVGRVLHQNGYATGGYGKHAPGFMLAIASYTTIEMLCLIAGVRQLMLS